MTYDNGKEAADHKTVTDNIGMKFYFAKTYSSWQRGTNENRNYESFILKISSTKLHLQIECGFV